MKNFLFGNNQNVEFRGPAGDGLFALIPAADSVYIGSANRNIDFRVFDNVIGGNNTALRFGTYENYVSRPMAVNKQQSATNAAFEVNGSAQADKYFFTTLVQLVTGNGSPEGAVTAKVGSLYVRADGGAGTTLYIKESGTGNTGWAAK